MTDASTLTQDVLIDAFERVAQQIPAVLDGLTDEQLCWAPDEQGNSIGWLVWHLTRVQDDHLAGVGDCEQVWQSAGFADRFALPYDRKDIGYGHSAAQVRSFVAPEPGLLAAYHHATHELTVQVVRGLDTAGFARIVDRRWTPPVTAAVRLVSVVNDTTQHVGQAAYLRGLLDRRP